MSGISKLDVLLHKTHMKVLLVLRNQGSTCVDPLTKIAHQMLCDLPFCQRNRLNEKTGGGQNLKGGGGGGGDRREALKIFHPSIIKPTPSFLASPRF